MTTTSQCNQAPGFTSRSTLPYFPSTTAQGQSRITYFITRSTGTPVPLIPADELPYTVKLQSVPRVLTPDQTYGLHYVGSAPYTGTTFKLEKSNYNSVQHFDCQPPENTLCGRDSSTVIARPFQAPDSLVRQPFSHDDNGSSQNLLSARPMAAYETSKSWRRPDPITSAPTNLAESEDPAQNAINAILRSQAGAETADRIGYRSQDRTPPPSGKVPDQEKKEWCTYWILHGDCAYVQQGCRYRHEMPDKAKLAEIGINHVPRWWLEQNSAIKLGGDRATVGPTVKPEVWLKTREGSDADSESSSTESAITSQSEKPMSSPKTILKPVVKPGIPTPSSSIEQARPSTPTELLINFAPLVPTPSTSTSSPTTAFSTPPSSQGKASKQSSPVASTGAPAKSGRSAKTTTAASVRSPARPIAKAVKVFVPAGESPEVHIADAKKRAAAARGRSSRTPSPTTKPSKTGEELEKLIREMRKTKHTSSGLSSSMHAPAPHAQESVKRKARTGCREHRPVQSSPSAASPVTKK